MQKNYNFGFRDPKETLKSIILDHGFDYQQDQPLLDRVGEYSFEVAAEVLRIIEIRLEGTHYIPQDELSDFIFSIEDINSVSSNTVTLH